MATYYSLPSELGSRYSAPFRVARAPALLYPVQPTTTGWHAQETACASCHNYGLCYLNIERVFICQPCFRYPYALSCVTCGNKVHEQQYWYEGLTNNQTWCEHCRNTQNYTLFDQRPHYYQAEVVVEPSTHTDETVSEDDDTPIVELLARRDAALAVPLPAEVPVVTQPLIIRLARPPAKKVKGQHNRTIGYCVSCKSANKKCVLSSAKKVTDFMLDGLDSNYHYQIGHIICFNCSNRRHERKHISGNCVCCGRSKFLARMKTDRLLDGVLYKAGSLTCFICKANNTVGTCALCNKYEAVRKASKDRELADGRVLLKHACYCKRCARLLRTNG